MASFNADILLAVRGSEKAKREIEKLEASLDRIGKKASLDISGQIRQKGAQNILKERIKDQIAWNKEQKKSQQIARETSRELARQAQRAQGLNQFPNGGVFPKPDLENEIRKRSRIRAIARATAKIEASRAARLAGQNSLTNGLLKLNKATLNAARADARARGEAVAKQRELNNELKKTQQYSKAIGPKQASKVKAGSRGAGGGGGGGGGLAAGIGFPLLFGGGPGSVIGGAVGSAGGFGTQILASAIGGIIDQTVASIAKLGQALNPLTADIDAVVVAAGESGTAFGQLVKELEEAAGKEAALEAATAQLANVIGQDGVDALQKFGDDVTTLGNDVSVALSQAAGAVATLVNNLGFLTAISESLQQDNLSRAAQESSDPEIQRLRAERRSIAIDNAQQFGDFFGDDLAEKLAAQDRLIAARQLELQTAEQTRIVDEATLAINKSKEALAEDLVAKAENQLALSRINAGLENDKVFELRLQGIELERNEEINQNILDLNNKQITRLQAIRKQIAINNKAEADRNKLQSDREKAQETLANKANRASEKSARDAERAAKKEQRVKQQLAQYEVENSKLAIQAIRLANGEAAAIEAQLENQDALLAKRIEVINLSGKDQRLKDKEIELAQVKNSLEKETLRNKLQEIALQTKLNKLKGEQELASLRAGLDQELAGLSLGESPAAKQRREQADRYENTLRGINDQIKEQKLLIDSLPTPNREAIDAANLRLDNLNQQKEAYEELLPAIAAAEQQQLAYNEALAAITPGVNALVSGIREVAAGTKTAEEAFADFLNTIADQLAQTAAQMIAQYIALGIARAFATGTNPTSGFNTGGVGQLFGDYSGLSGIPFAGAFADGGTIPSGQFGLVGENGPEFISGPANITPMGEAGNTVVNITVNSNGGGTSSASGSDAQEAARLGRLIERSTLAIINREKRPGGTLSR